MVTSPFVAFFERGTNAIINVLMTNLDSTLTLAQDGVPP
jgi:hypothetical protein